MSYNIVNYQFSNIFREPNPGLEMYLRSNKAGNMNVVRTPLFNDKDPQKVVDDWFEILEGSLGKDDKFRGLLTFESDMRKKVGPLSCRFPLNKRLNSVLEYYKYIDLGEPVLDVAVTKVVQEILQSDGRLNKVSQSSVIGEMVKSTNSGAPFFEKRRRALEESVPYKIQGNTQVIGGRDYTLASVLGWRGQEGGPNPENVKQRDLWMFPMCANISEAMVYNPLIRTCQSREIVAPWIGNDAVDIRMTQLFKTKARDQVVVATDFTAFDQHINFRCQDAVKGILSNLFNDLDPWLEAIYPIKYNIPIVLDLDRMVTGPHGMASGSGGTNADETLLHRAFQFEAALTYGTELNRYSMCLGDDGVITYDGVTVEDVIKSYTRHGVEMNAEKQWVSAIDTTFLKRWHSAEYEIQGINRGVYSTCRALGKLMYMERFHSDWSDIDVLIRTLSIINNVEWHPLRDKFAEYCAKGERYGLGTLNPSKLSAVSHLLTDSNEQALEYLPYTAQLNLKGVKPFKDWWICKWIRRNM